MSPETQYLLSAVEKKYGRRTSTSTDFESLSAAIFNETGQNISSSTLKRLWGKMSLKPVPRTSSLNILSKYVGYSDFAEFIEVTGGISSRHSAFTTIQAVVPSDLELGDRIILKWSGDRKIEVEYVGVDILEVKHSENSLLRKGDRFVPIPLFVGYPLCIPRILRDGKWTESYVTGTDNGISSLKLIKSNKG